MSAVEERIDAFDVHDGDFGVVIGAGAGIIVSADERFVGGGVGF